MTESAFPDLPQPEHPSSRQVETTHYLIGPACPAKHKPRLLEPDHDAWGHGALSINGLRITDLLHRHPDWHTQASVSEALGLQPGAVNRHVGPDAPLVYYGLVERNSAGHVRAGSLPDRARLDRIAVEMGTSGRRAALLASIRREYEERGDLDDEGWWLDRTTRERKSKAEWLT